MTYAKQGMRHAAHIPRRALTFALHFFPRDNERRIDEEFERRIGEEFADTAKARCTVSAAQIQPSDKQKERSRTYGESLTWIAFSVSKSSAITAFSMRFSVSASGTPNSTASTNESSLHERPQRIVQTQTLRQTDLPSPRRRFASSACLAAAAAAATTYRSLQRDSRLKGCPVESANNVTK